MKKKILSIVSIMMLLVIVSVSTVIPVHAATNIPDASIVYVKMYPANATSYEDSIYVFGQGNDVNQDVTLNDLMIDYYKNKGYSNGWFVEVKVNTGGATGYRVLTYGNVDMASDIYPVGSTSAIFTFHLDNIINASPPNWEIQLFNGKWSPSNYKVLWGNVWGTENLY
mgnify:CR=1 FL=1